MAWVSDGTADFTNNSKIVTGIGTSWFGQLQAGWGLVAPNGAVHELESVESATQLTLVRPYQGATAAAQNYQIFPTMSLAAALTLAVQQLISDFQGVKDTYGAGRLPVGTLEKLALAFAQDSDTGIYRPGDNILAIVTGQIEQLRLTGGLASGAAVQDSANDAAAGKLMKNKAFGHGLVAKESPQVTQDMDDQAIPSGATIYAGGSTTNKPDGKNGAGLVWRGWGGAGANGELHQLFGDRLGPGQNPALRYRSSDTDGNWADWVEILTGAILQSDPLDTTAGKLLINGGHGLGAKDSSAVVVSDGHADLPTGFYGGGGGAAVNFPPSANYRPFLNLTRRIGPDQYRQIRMFFGSGNTPVIRYSDDKGVTWHEDNALYGMANILGTVSETGGVPTGAVIERGHNANGEYARFADGTQICSAPLLIPYAGSAVTLQLGWSYPADFSARPTIMMTPMDFRDGGAPAGGNWSGGELINTYTRVTGTGSATLYASKGASWVSGDAVAVHASAFGRWF